MQGRAHALGREMVAQSVARRVPCHVEMPRALDAGGLNRQPQRRAGEQFVVAQGDAATGRVPRRQVLQLHAEHGALDALHAVIVAHFVMEVAFRRTVLP